MLLCRMKNSARTSTVWMLQTLDIGSPDIWCDSKGYMVTQPCYAKARV